MLPSHFGRVGTWWAEGHPLVPGRWMHTDDWQLTRLARISNAYKHHTRWLRPSWWAYIWRAPERLVRRDGRYATVRQWRGLNPWRVRWCRLHGHPNGYVYFNAGGFEPDYSCRDCGEEIH